MSVFHVKLFINCAMDNENQLERQNWNNRFQHFQIQPIKCPVQNNEISTCSLTCDVYATTVSVKCQAQTGRTFMCLRLRNNFMLHSVYFRSLVDIENKSCVRVPLVIHCLSASWITVVATVQKSPSNGLWAVSLEQLSQGIWRAFFKTRKYSNPTSGTLTIYIYEWHSYTILVF